MHAILFIPVTNILFDSTNIFLPAALPKLLASMDSMDLFLRHGSIIGASEIIHALYKITQKQDKYLKFYFYVLQLTATRLGFVAVSQRYQTLFELFC